MQTELKKIRSRIIDRIVVLSATLLIFPLIISLLRFTKIGWQNIYLFHILIYLLLLATALFKKRLSTSLKIIILSFLFLFLTFLGLYFYSIGGGYFFAILVIAILSLLVDQKITIWLMIGLVLMFVFFAVSFITGFLTPKVDLNLLSKLGYHWVGHILALFLLTLIFIYGFGDIYKELLETLKKKGATEKKYRELFEKANDAIILIKNDTYFDCNNKACELFQYEKSDLLGKAIIEISPEKQYEREDSGTKAKKLLKLAMEDKPQCFEWQHKKANGELFDVSISLNKIELYNEVYVQAILRDITEKKKKDVELEMHRNNLEELVKEKTKDLKATLEEWKSTSEELALKRKIIENQNEELIATNEELKEKNEIIIKQNEELKTTLKHLKETQMQLLQAEKMASLGTLTAGVSHEINNPLNYIMGSYVGLERYFENNGSKDKKITDILLNSIKVGLERASGIVRGLNQFSRNNKIIDESCDLHALIDNCLLMLYSQYKNYIEIHKQYNQEPLTVLGNTGQLHQVFTSILTNSIQAITDKGEIIIETKDDDINAVVEITDTGCGIKKDHISQITDPFFTTKPPGEGTGLGLSITYTIIKEHKGEIKFTSEVNKGTKVKITLPKDK